MSTAQGTATHSPSAAGMTWSDWALLMVLCGAIFLEGADVSMMGVALPSIRSELSLSTSSLQWVVSAYVLGYGGFVLLGGRAADLFGRRRMFLLWLAIFLAFSGLGGLAVAGWQLIAARFVTGVSAGFLAPAGLSIITTTFAEGQARNKALLVYAGTGGAGFSIGVVLGGLLTAIDWRWVFFAPVIMAAVILIFAVRVIPNNERAAESRGAFDIPGAITLSASMLLLAYAVVQAPEVEWQWTAAGFLASTLFLATFVIIERRSAAPLVRLGILRSSALVRANLATMLFIGSFVAFQFIAVLYLQELRGWSPLETGLTLLAVGIDAILAPTITPHLVTRFGHTRVILVGMVTAVLGYAAFLRVEADWSYAAMLPTMLLLGISFSLAFGSLTIAATEGIPDEDQGLASGILSVSLQFGAALGIAIVAAVYTATVGTDDSGEALLGGYRAALVVPLLAASIGAAVVAPGLRRGRPRSRRT